MDNKVQIVINVDGKQATAELQTVGGKIKDLGPLASSSGERMASSWKQFVPGVGVLAGIAGVSLGINQLIQSTVQLGMRMETLSLSYKAITGTSYAAAQELEFVRATANRLGADFEGLAQGYKSISAAAMNTSLEGQQTRDIFVAVSEASAALGLSAEETKGSLLALGQMISKGTVQAEELKGQLGERLPGAFQLAARAMGVTTAELQKMLEQGEVVATDFLPKLAKAMHEQYKGSAGDAANTARGAINLLGNEMVRLGQNIWNSGLDSAFTSLINKLTQATKASNDYDAAMEKANRRGNVWQWQTQTSPTGFIGLGEVSGQLPPSFRKYDTSSAIEQNIMTQRRIEANQRASESEKTAEEQTKRLSSARALAVKVDTDATKALWNYTQQWQALDTVRKEIGEENYWRKVGAATDDYNKALTKGTKTISGSAAAQRDWDNVLKEGESIRKSTLTEFELYQQEIQKLDWCLKANVITWDEYGKAVEKAGGKIGLLSDRQREARNNIAIVQSYESAYGKSIVEPSGTQAGMDAGIKTGGSFNAMASNAWKDHQKDLKDTDKQYQELLRTIEGFGKDSSGALADFFMGTQTNFSTMIKSMMRDMIQMIIYETFMKKLFGWASTGIGGMLGGFLSGGNASGYSLSPRASGGPVSAGGWYLVGEDGPELLRAGGSGSVIPNGGKLSNGGGSKIETTINVTVAHSGGGQTDPASVKAMADQVGMAVKAKFNECLMEHMRPGGLLNRGRSN